jgi:hypothetical protein
MNCLMAGMVPVMTLAMASTPGSRDPSAPAFWFIMSMALLVGFITAYPMNWWLVSRHMKHGMMTVRSADDMANGGTDKTMQDKHTPGERSGGGHAKSKPAMGGDAKPLSTGVLAWMTILSFMVFGVGYSLPLLSAVYSVVMQQLREEYERKYTDTRA